MMKKFLTILLILITTMGLGFANVPEPVGLLHSASCNFLFTLNKAGAAVTSAGFFKTPTTGANSIEKMADLVNKSDVADNIVYNRNTGWEGISNVYAIVGTNWAKDGTNLSGGDTTGGVATIKITLAPFINEDDTSDKLGYTVNCSVITNLGYESVSIDVSTPITVGTDKSEDIIAEGFGAKMGATGGEPAAENGILEFKFSNMNITSIPAGPNYKPTTWNVEAVQNYKAVWTMTVVTI